MIFGFLEALHKKKLRYLMGRLIEECWEIRNGLITSSRVRDRGFNFEKIDDGFTFEISRHPGAFRNGYVSKLVVQKWKVNILEGFAEEVTQRNWKDGDQE